MATSTVTTIALTHPDSLSAGEIASLTSSILQVDAPIVVASIPSVSPGTQQTVLGYVGLANLGFQVFAQIFAAIHSAHMAKANA